MSAEDLKSLPCSTSANLSERSALMEGRHIGSLCNFKYLSERISNEFERHCRKNKLSFGGRELKRSRSDSALVLPFQPDKVSVHSEPTPCRLSAQNLTESQKSHSDVNIAHNFLETDSDISFNELVQQQKSSDPHCHRDPVVVFWERSERRQNIENDIIVKFSLCGGEVFTQSFSKSSTVEEMKRVVGEMFKVPFSVLQLEQNGFCLCDNYSISDIAIERFGSVTLQLSSIQPERFPLILNNVYPDIPTNDVLTVLVQKEDLVKEVIVEIENRAIAKPFLGGYRHKETKLEYHHAFTQTAPKPSKGNIVSRNTQTLGPCKVVDTSKSKFTQTCCINSEMASVSVVFGDPERRLKKMQDEKKAYEDKVVLIQRNLRSWLVRKMMLKMKEEYRRCIEWEKLQLVRVEEEKEGRRLEKEKAQTRPELRGHFEILYHNLEEWRKMEADRINSLGSVALRKSEAFSVLEMEIQYINSIEKQRIQHKKEQNRREQEKLIEKTASPIKWKGSGGHIIFLDSLETQKARSFRTLYLKLKRIDVTTEERIKILQDVKSNILCHENGLVPELISLLDREQHILLRDIKPSNIDLLRDRINFMFLEYIKDPNVNSEARKHLPESSCQRAQMYKCVSCQNVLPYFKFSLHSKANNFRKCRNCLWQREIGGPRTDVNPIRHIMKAVRREELKESYYTSVALIMQEQDFYHLIINIWLGHSAIGGCGNLEELRLGRWDFTQTWSPWNCILLTAAELKAHLRFPNPDQIYSLSFVRKIKQRHQMGRIYFSELAAHVVAPESTIVSKMVQNFKASQALIDKMTKTGLEREQLIHNLS